MRARWTSTAALTLLLFGCAEDLGIDEFAFACAADRDCARGKVCHPIVGQCVDPSAIRPADADVLDTAAPIDVGFAPDASELPIDTGPATPPTVVTRLQAAGGADDDGGNAPTVTEAQITEWVDHANTAYAAADVRLRFDPVNDVITATSSMLNAITRGLVSSQVAAGNAIADERPEAITVLVRRGPRGPASTDHVARLDARFLVLPDYPELTRCGAPSPAMFSYVFGLYLGLRPPSSMSFTSTAAAAAHQARVGHAEAFDDDGIEDTPADPNISAHHCTEERTVTLNGSEYLIPRDNVMSHYRHPDKDLTFQQAAVARQAFLLRSGRSVADLFGGDVRIIEAEAAPPRVTAGRVATQTRFQGGALWSGAGQLLWISGKMGDRLTTTFSVRRTGVYRFFIAPTRSWDYGIHQYEIDGEEIGTPIDTYAKTIVVRAPVELGEVMLEAGAHQLAVEIVGTSAPNPNRFYFGLDFIALLPR